MPILSCVRISHNLGLCKNALDVCTCAGRSVESQAYILWSGLRFELGEILYYLRGASGHIPFYMTLTSKSEIQSNQYARSFGPTEGHAPLCRRSHRGGKLSRDSL